MIEVLKQALEAIKKGVDGQTSIEMDDATTSLRQAIAELESQEPVAWQIETYIAGVWSPMGNPQRNKNRAENLSNNPSIPKENQRIIPLYTHPPQRTERKPIAMLFGSLPVYDTSPQRTEQEPVKDWVASHNAICALLRQAHDALALTSYPPQRTWVGLTDEEIEQLHTAWVLGGGFRKLCNAIEAKLKEKNT
jgi:hypothetical protein